MLIMEGKENKKYITLKEAAKISGYVPDYIGWLIREEKIEGIRIYNAASWQTTRESILKYKNRKKQKTVKPEKDYSKKLPEFIDLKEAAKISGYAPDYVGWLIRAKKIEGRKTYTGVSWQTTEEAIKNYQAAQRQNIINAAENTENAINDQSEKVLTPQSIEVRPQYIKIKKYMEIGYQYISGFKKNLKNLRSIKNRKILNTGWRFGLSALFVALFISGLILQGPILSAITGEKTEIVNFYTTVCEGQWENSQNEYLPDLGVLDCLRHC